MKRYISLTLLRLTLLTLGLVLLCGQAQAQATLVAHYPLHEGKGNTITNASGSNFNGTLQGNAGWTQQGRAGKPALNLTGRGHIEIPAPIIDTSKSFTISAWVRLHKLGGYQTFVSIDGDTISGVFFQLRSDTGKFALHIPANSNTGEIATASATVAPAPNVWYHLLGYYDSNKRQIGLYLNGILQQTADHTTPWKATGHTAIGRGKYNGNPVDFVNADIEDVKIYQGVAIDNAELDRIATETKSKESVISLKVANPTRVLSPTLYGLMIEDINHSIDGGLYAELIQNRNLKEPVPQNDPTRIPHWSPTPSNGGTSIALDTNHPVKETALTHSLRVELPGDTSAATPAGVANEGYWGIPVRPNTRYRASLYARAVGYSGPLTLAIQSIDGKTTYAQTRIGGISADWKPFTATLTTGKAPVTADTRFVVLAQGKGTLWLTQVSLFPPTWNNRPNGTRKDLMQILADMKPSFLRLPGGNFLEGDYINERFNWYETVGDISKRPGHRNPWGYPSTDGFGLLEYLEWCEDLKMEPVLGIYAGYSLRGDHVEPGPALQPFVQEALDEIEYIIGATDTKWGAQRAADGHPKPFPLTYVEIGNEDWLDRSGSYERRFAPFFDAIRAKYPKLKLIATMQVKSRVPDMIDDHYYRTANMMAGDAHHYDDYPRNAPKIFVGEWASQDIDTPWVRANEKGPTPTLNSALGDAAWMTGMERNSDVILISAYAPLFVNVNKNARQWAINLIGFDALNSYGSPSYYAQKMFSLYHGDRVCEGELSGLHPLYFVASKSTKTNTLYLKVVNMQPTAQSTKVVLADAKSVGKTGKAIVMKGTELTDTNTLQNPTNIVPVTSNFTPAGTTFDYTFPPYSVTILTFPVR